MTIEQPARQSFGTQVRVARAVAENLRPIDLAAELADGVAGVRVMLVDVREPEEARGGVIEGAVVIPRGTIEFAIGLAADLGNDLRVVVYCSTGERSALVVRTLYGLGLHDVAHLEGGVEAWVSDGRPLVPWPGGSDDPNSPRG